MEVWDRLKYLCNCQYDRAADAGSGDKRRAIAGTVRYQFTALMYETPEVVAPSKKFQVQPNTEERNF